jgi:hypothetical protein
LSRRWFAAALLAAIMLYPSISPTAAEAEIAPPGANVPFTTYEAENAATNGTRIGPSYAFTEPAAEASGRRAVSLRAGQWVEFTLRARADAVNVRYSVPDGSPDAKLRVSTGTDLTLTARYSHVYGNYPYTNNPADGGEHHYFDDAHALLGRTLAAGTRVRFTATAPVVLDAADFEPAGPPAARPAGFLSVTDFGADPTGVTDAGPAIQSAIDAGAQQGKGVWLPAGTFRVQQHLSVNAVTVRGAGPWHTVLKGAGVGIFGAGAGVHLAGLAIAGDTTVRDDSTSDSGLGGTLGGGSTVDDVWIEHTKVGMWFDGPSDGLTISHARIQDTMADGVNLHNGVAHTVIRDTFVRNTGDDGLAMWSDGNADHDNAFVHDTVVAPLLANGFAVYGGRDNQVTDSVAADTVTQGGGVHVGNRFGAVPLAGTTTIARNVLLRDGNLVPNQPDEIGALWFYAADAPMTGAVDVHDVSIVDSPFAAVQFFGQPISNVTLDRVAIVRAGTFAVQLQAPGSARFTNVVATGLGAAGRYDCGSGFVVSRGPGDVGWSSTRCGFPPAGALRLSADSLEFGNLALHETATRALSITNTGPDPITVRSVRATEGYTIGGSCTTIAVGATCAVAVGFSPGRAGVLAGKLSIDSTSPAGPYVVALHGIGFDPDGNLAIGQQVTASSQALSWLGPANLVDGDPGTYFESANNAFPQTVTLDLGGRRTVDRLVLRLPANWGTRTETIAVAADGTALVPAAGYELNPDTGNAVTISFPSTTVRTLTLTFTGNTGWPAAQLSELEVHAH